MAVIGPKYNGMFIDIVSPLQSAAERDYNKFRNINKEMQEGMKALGTGIGDARKYFERKAALDKLGANEDEISRLERLIKDLDVQIANTKSGRNEAENANIGIKKWEIPSKNEVEGGPYPFSNQADLDANDTLRDLREWEEQPNDPLMKDVDYNWRAYGRKSGLV